MKSVSSTTVNNITILSVASALVGGKAVDELRQKVLEMVNQEQRNLVIDLHGVPYANSEGIGVLMLAYISYKHRGWHLALCGLDKEINVIMAITKLNSVFEIYKTREEAVAHFSTIP